MSDKKIIIRNCPCYYLETCGAEGVEEQYCQDCTDCVMKQIVELCVNEINYSDRWSESRAFAKELLDTIDIQEVE